VKRDTRPRIKNPSDYLRIGKTNRERERYARQNIEAALEYYRYDSRPMPVSLECYRCDHTWIGSTDVVPARCPRCEAKKHLEIIVRSKINAL